MERRGILRIVDFGTQPPLRSQTLWHAIAFGVSEGSPPTLSFVRPSDPYVSVGRLHPLTELDLEICRRLRLPVYRRMVGGGTVYLDSNQLFFQITVPTSWVPCWPAKAMRTLLEPAVLAFRDLGIPAAFDEHGEIVWNGAKISGTAGAQIDEAMVAVGNLIESFDYDIMAKLLHAPDKHFRMEFLRLLRRHLRPTPVDPTRFKRALMSRYAEAFGLSPELGELSREEVAKVAELDRLFCDPDWIHGPARPPEASREVKVRSGVWVFASAFDGTNVVGSVVNGRLERVYVHDPRFDGRTAEVERAFRGLSMAQLQSTAEAYGELGQRVLRAVAQTRRIEWVSRSSAGTL